MLKKFMNFRSREIGLFSPLSLLRLVLYLIILYSLFNYYMYGSVVIISLALLIISFVFLPYPKTQSWLPTIIGFGGTGGVAYILFKIGLRHISTYILIIGISISSWLIPDPTLFAMLLVLLISVIVNLPIARHSDQPAMVEVQEYNANENVVKPYLESPEVSAEAKKIDEVYLTNIAAILTTIGWEIWYIVVDPKKRASFIAGEIISKTLDQIGEIGGLAITKLFSKRAKDGSESESISLQRIASDIDKLTKYLTIVHKSRKAEIKNSTGLTEKQTHALLEYLQSVGVLVHEPACFWRFRTESDEDVFSVHS